MNYKELLDKLAPYRKEWDRARSSGEVLAAQLYDALTELASKVQKAETILEKNGHEQPCYYCQEPCDSLSGDPGRWPIPLCHLDDPGKVKWHHTGCVSSRLASQEIELKMNNAIRELVVKVTGRTGWNGHMADASVILDHEFAKLDKMINDVDA